jgi:hypothetical protein
MSYDTTSFNPQNMEDTPSLPLSLISPFVKDNQAIDLNAILNNSDRIDTDLLYDIHNVMGSTQHDGKVLSIVKSKSCPAKNCGPGNLAKVFIH